MDRTFDSTWAHRSPQPQDLFPLVPRLSPLSETEPARSSRHSQSRQSAAASAGPSEPASAASSPSAGPFGVRNAAQASVSDGPAQGPASGAGAGAYATRPRRFWESARRSALEVGSAYLWNSVQRRRRTSTRAVHGHCYKIYSLCFLCFLIAKPSPRGFRPPAIICCHVEVFRNDGTASTVAWTNLPLLGPAAYVLRGLRLPHEALLLPEEALARRRAQLPEQRRAQGESHAHARDLRSTESVSVARRLNSTPQSA